MLQTWASVRGKRGRELRSDSAEGPVSENDQTLRVFIEDISDMSAPCRSVLLSLNLGSLLTVETVKLKVWICCVGSSCLVSITEASTTPLG